MTVYVSKRTYLGVVMTCPHFCLVLLSICMRLSTGKHSQPAALLGSTLTPYFLHGCLCFKRYYRHELGDKA